MQIIPAIDLKDGHCVRLLKGDFSAVTQYKNAPLDVALEYQQQGAAYLHIVDLDGARNASPQHTTIIEAICQATQLTIQVGGGIRSTAQIENLLAAGVARVIIGSMAITDAATVKAWLEKFGADKIVLALDILQDEQQTPWLYTHAWQEKSLLSLWDLLADFQSSGLKHVLCTDIARDGTLTGPNITLYQHCQARFPTMSFQASGGVGSLKDIIALKQINLAAAIIGKALYENKVSLVEILAEVIDVS